MQDKLNDMQAQLAKRERDSITVVRTLAAANFVIFKIDTWDLTNEARVQLGLFAETIKKADPNVVYVITGYADKGTGSVERNVILSKNRARVVYECLVNEFGVPKKEWWKNKYNKETWPHGIRDGTHPASMRHKQE